MGEIPDIQSAENTQSTLDGLADCDASYRSAFLDAAEASELFHHLQVNFDLTSNVTPMADGTKFEAEYGSYLFTEDNLLGHFGPEWGVRGTWPDELRSVRDRIQATTGVRFHVCRSIFYPDGTSGMSYHRDLPAYGPTDMIASISLGAERRFCFRNARTQAITPIVLEHGSLLMMGKGCQEHYEHSLPVDPNLTEPRLNLTFRVFEAGADA